MESVAFTPDPASAPAEPTNQPEVVFDAFGKATVVPAGTPTPETPQRPAWLPEKFESGEALAKSYAELEKAFHAKGGTKPAEPPATPPATPPAPVAGIPTITPEAPKEPAAAPAGIDMAAIGAEFTTNGGLSPETYEALAAKGMDKATVDTFIAGQQAIATRLRADIASVAGGEEQLNAVLAWANQNLSPEAVAAYNAAAATKDVGLVKLALTGIVSQFNAANPKEPTFVKGGSNAPPTADGALPWSSNAEMIAAINDPRYAKDPAYRKMVEARHAATK